MANTLKISEACSIALHTMAIMAAKPDANLTTKELAHEIQASENSLSKVMQRLNKAGFIQAIRGPKGGFRLANNIEKRPLLDIFEAIEGPFIVTGCVLGKPVCNNKGCIFGGLLEKANLDFYNHLKNTTLEQVGGHFTL